MFYDVKILDPQGNIKENISGQELAKRHWNEFFIAEANKTLYTSKFPKPPMN